MKLSESMGNVQLTSTQLAKNADAGGFDPWQLVKSVLSSDLFGRLIGIERVLAALNTSVTGFVSYPGDPERVQGETARIHVVKSGSFEVCIVVSALSIPMDA